MNDANRELVDLGDLDELARQAGRLAAAGDWPGLRDLRDRCRAALDRGKQLWPVASRCEYLLALRAPAAWAGPVVVDGAGLFAPGPLAEVVASTHTWQELSPHLEAGPLAAVVLHERVVRGEDLVHDGRALDPYLDLPARLQPWEPAYAVATYHEDRPVAAELPLAEVTAVDLPPPGRPVEDPAVDAALREVVRPWVTASNGQVRVAAVEGTGPAAVARLQPGTARLARLEPADALAYVAWTGASGGAHGRRRGAAAGRTNAWWAGAALAGLDDWPVDPDHLGEAVAELRWWRWEVPQAVTGWRFHLAVEDPAEGLAWAVAAADAR